MTYRLRATVSVGLALLTFLLPFRSFAAPAESVVSLLEALRAQGVNTVAFVFDLVTGLNPSYSAKKNVLFFTMGPPTLAVY